MKLNKNQRRLRFNEEMFSQTIIGFVTNWDCKANEEYISEKIKHIMPIYELHLKCDCSDGSLRYSVSELIFVSFAADKSPGFNFFCEVGITHFKIYTNLKGTLLVLI